MPDLFTKFGGHRQAAGVTLDASRVEEFRARFRAFASGRLTEADFEPEIEIDAEMGFDEVTDQTVAELLNLAPFGFGNAPPTLVVRGAEVVAAPDVKNDKHLFLRLKSQGKIMRAKAWNFAERAAEFAPGTPIDVALQLKTTQFAARAAPATIVRDEAGGLRFAIQREAMSVHRRSRISGGTCQCWHDCREIRAREFIAEGFAGLSRSSTIFSCPIMYEHA